MKYFLIAITIVTFFFLGSVQSQAQCEATLLNCVSDGEFSLAWCAYDSSSFWDTLYSASSGDIADGNSATVSCDSTSGCYVVGKLEEGIFLCTSFTLSGSVSCNEYACVDTDSTGSITWNSGFSEFCCDGTGGDACQTCD